jgi:hypothetical protein
MALVKKERKLTKESNLITIDTKVLDKKKDAEQRKSILRSLSDCDSQQAFDLTLQLYRTVDTQGKFKGYQKNVHRKQNTEFLFFRDILRQNVYKHFVQNQKDCLSKLETLKDEKNLDDVVKDELADIWKVLTGDTVIQCYDIPESDINNAELVCRIKGNSLDEVMVEAIADYITIHSKKNLKRNKSNYIKHK